MADGDNSNLLRELDVLSQTLYHAHTARRTASLVLPRSSDAIPTVPANVSLHSNAPISDARPRSRRLSMSPFRSRQQPSSTASDPTATKPLPPAADMEKKGIWSWKPLRALSHIRMDRLSVLVSVEVVAIQFLPASMNGLRLSVCVRKKESKEGAVQTMPARVLQGAADFEETLFIRCHVYCSGGGSTGKPLRFEPRPFLIFPIAVDASELNFGQSSVDLSSLVKESMERSLEGSRVRQWDTAFKLSGKAKGGELVVKLGFQIMDDSGVGLYRQASEIGSVGKGMGYSSSSSARRQSKSSFSIPSPKPAPSKEAHSTVELKSIEEFNLDEDPAPAPFPPPTSQIQMEYSADELELPEFEVVDKGIEAGLRDREDVVEVASEQAAEKSSGWTELVHDSAHNVILTELDSIAKQIKALELTMMNDKSLQREGEGKSTNLYNVNPEGETQKLDDEEETATREFLQMLENEDDKEEVDMYNSVKTEAGHEGEAAGYLSDLGKGLGSIVQTRDGGYLASMNPFDMEIQTREAPKLTMQISRPIIIDTSPDSGGFEVFQNFAGKGLEELGMKLLSLTSMDEIAGKTAEQIAFEGVASAIVSGRKKELAKSAAAKSIAALKAMALEMNAGRKERIATGIWNVREEPLPSVEETLSFSLQKMEAMAIDALKLQAGVPEEEAPFDVSPLFRVGGGGWVLDDAASLEDWLKKSKGEEGKPVILMVLVQLRDPVRRYEAVGAPMISLVQVARVLCGEEEVRYRVCGLHIGGMRLSLARKTRGVWDGERQRLTAMQWLVGNGLAKAGKKSKAGGGATGDKDVFWSFSSRVMAGMWLKPTRNPDVKLLHL